MADVLFRKHPLWQKHSGYERTQVMENSSLRPDIVIRQPGGQPVIVETEFAPARGVEQDALSRLGDRLRHTGERIDQVLAVRIPIALSRGQERLTRRISESLYEYCVFSADSERPYARWPETGWIEGSIDNLARCIEHAVLSEQLVAKGLDVLERAVLHTTQMMQDSIEQGFPDAAHQIADVLHQEEGEQTLRLAMTILANALTFHMAISGAHRIPTLDALRIQDGAGPPAKRQVLDCWRRIREEINYWPIFDIARRILEPMPARIAQPILDRLAQSAGELVNVGITTMHDLTGRLFQALIADRKFLATFYTLPSSAALLAELSVSRLGCDWTQDDAYTQLQIADFACGTGTLLSAAYQAVLARYRRAGQDDKVIHRAMIEKSLIAADIMPAATHLAASQLSSAHPSVTFADTRVYTLPYGKDAERGKGQEISIGSLDLIQDARAHALFPTGAESQLRGGGEAQTTQNIHISAQSVDLVIMNPPFPRPTNHESATVPVPSFAGFETPADEQREMSKRLKKIRDLLKLTGTQPAGHGNAGLATNFVDLAHAKVKPGGVIALVLELTFLRGDSWKNARRLIEKHYGNVTIVSIAAIGNTSQAFSADTGMAEVLVVATRRKSLESRDATAASRALFVSLLRRPCSLMEASEVAAAITRIPPDREDGRLASGGAHFGGYIRAALDEGGGSAGLRSSALAYAMLHQRRSEFRIPQVAQSYALPVAWLGELGSRGKLDRDINGENRGPFDVFPLKDVPSYPMLWAHDASRERRLIVLPDTQGDVRPGRQNQADQVWKTATRLHFNRDFRFNSQSLAACLTPERALGGRAWPNFQLRDTAGEKVVVLWANSTLGLMDFWWVGSRQQQGRAVLTISRVSDLIVIDPGKLAPSQLEKAEERFDALKEQQLLPANEAYRDPVRQALDRFVLLDLLELPADVLEPFDRLRLQWCAEPSVHGGKSTAPPDCAQ